MLSLVLVDCEKLSSDTTTTFHPPGHFKHSITIKKWERQATSRVSPEVSKSTGRTSSTGELLVILSNIYPESWAVDFVCANWLMWFTRVKYVASFFHLFLSPSFNFGSKDCSRVDHKYSKGPERKRTSSNNTTFCTWYPSPSPQQCMWGTGEYISTLGCRSQPACQRAQGQVWDTGLYDSKD